LEVPITTTAEEDCSAVIIIITTTITAHPVDYLVETITITIHHPEVYLEM